MWKKKEDISSMNDRELVWLTSETGRRIYWRELYSRYLPLIYGVCLRYIAGKDEVKDAVRDLYDILFVRLKRETEAVNGFRSWLYTELLSYARHYYNPETPQPYSAPAGKSAKLRDKLCVDCQETYSLVNKYSERLSDSQQECMGMFFGGEMTFEQISGNTNYRIDEVKSHIREGLDAISRALFTEKEEAGYGFAAVY